MSLKKIAEMTGVSTSTVSRVLNNVSSTCASKEVRDKIFAAAREIGYQPNESARKLRNSADNTTAERHVSIVLARIKTLEADPFFYELFRELEIALFQNSILIDHIIYAEETLSQDVSKSNGVLILGRCSRKLFEQIMAASKNVIAIWRNSMDFDVDEVVCDGRNAAELAMRHLISLGHKNIAYIGDCSYESRYIGYCNSLIHNNIPINYDWIKQTDQTGESGSLAFRELLEQSNDFSAVFCANDITAISVLGELKEKRRQIKRKISVISIDNIEESQDTSPYLTTINIPRKEMAHMAVTLLLDRINKGHSENIRIEFPCRIVNRDSCYPFNENNERRPL
ncbi:MAG: LacI family DNA-binding transcriptional regulator [Lachnospiraceae bacterium]|nr:LacI family DNA-binding transcriptional regulator [Lachnospiraceae bacterium]